MENATKALIIAAVILVVIVLIAGGVLILKGSSGTAEQGETTGKTISVATDNAVKDFQRASISAKEFNKFIQSLTKEGMAEGIEIGNKKIRDQVTIEGYVANVYGNKLSIKVKNSNNETVTCTTSEDLINYWIPYHRGQGRMISITNPTDINHAKEKLREAMRIEDDSEYIRQFTNDNFRASTMYGYDSDGYINGVYIVYMLRKKLQ